jgi:hypothetical protein
MAKAIRSDAAIVGIEGLAELQRELRRLSAEAPKELRKTHLEAAEYVRDRARAKARSVGPMQAKAATTLVAAAEQRYAKVRLGKAGVAWGFALGAEYGARAYPQFPAWRGNQWTDEGGVGVGYFLHPAIRESGDGLLDLYDRELAALTRRAFPH